MLAILPFILLFVAALGFVGLTMVATHLLGPKIKGSTKDANFECGIDSVENARIPFSVKQFLVAILFVLFDVEIVFMYPWAINFKELGWNGFFAMIAFVSMVGVVLVYIYKKGVLDFIND